MKVRTLALLASLVACSGGGTSPSSSPDALPSPDGRPAADGAPGSVPDSAPRDAPAAAPDGRVAPDAPIVSPTPDAPPSVPPPSITSVRIQGFPGTTQVRQGQSVTLVVAGTHFGDVVYASLGDRMLFPTTKTEVELDFDVLIRSGDPLGAVDLVLHTGDVDTTRAAAITVTPIAVTLAGDDGNIGTFDAPLRTITAAMGVALGGDTISVGPGTFGAGEAPQIFFDSRVTVLGAGSDKTIIQGVEVVLFHGAVLKHAKIPCFFDDSSPFPDETQLIDVVVAAGCQTGILLRYSALLMDVKVAAAGTGVAIQSVGADTYTLDGVEIAGAAKGLIVTGEAFAKLDHVTVAGGHDTGIEIGGSAQATVRAADVTVLGPVGLDRGAAVYVWSSGAVLDFGTATDAGGNVLTGDIWSLEDDRPVRAAADGPILTLSSSTLGNVVIAPMVYVGPATVGYLGIRSAGNRVQVF